MSCASVPLPDEPFGLSVDPTTRTAYVDVFGANFADTNVDVIDATHCSAADTSACVVKTELPTGRRAPLTNVLDASTHTLYVLNNAGGDEQGTVSVVDTRLCNGSAVGTAPAARELQRTTDLALGESGDSGNTKLGLGEAGIDVPLAEATLGQRNAIAAIIARADQVLRPKLVGSGHGEISRVSLLGGPGQGKSTITRLLFHVYRAAMLGPCGRRTACPHRSTTSSRWPPAAHTPAATSRPRTLSATSARAPACSDRRVSVTRTVASARSAARFAPIEHLLRPCGADGFICVARSSALNAQTGMPCVVRV